MKCNLKFNPPENFVDYIMPPIEVIRYNIDLKKSEWKRKLLLMQPDYISEEMVNKAFDIAKKKNPDQVVSKISLLQLNEGLCIQTMHTGSYELEKSTISFLKKEAKSEGYELSNDLHEVFINDPRRTIAKKLQTIIRFTVKKIPGKDKSSTAKQSSKSPTKAKSAAKKAVTKKPPLGKKTTNKKSAKVIKKIGSSKKAKKTSTKKRK